MSNSVVEFYDGLAKHYHLIYGDWEQSLRRQSQALHTLIQQNLKRPPENVSLLDCSCGIGTQAIGLALIGYRVHATDLSPNAVERAKKEARRLGAEARFAVADMRDLEHCVEGLYDVVISCDNSVPHLMKDGEILRAASGMRAKLSVNGLLLIGTRDYDRMVEQRPPATPVRIVNGPHGRAFVFQVLDWADDGRSYGFEHFIVHETRDGWQTIHGRGEYRALLRAELTDLLGRTGFSHVRWHMPEETGYFETVVTAVPSTTHEWCST